MNGEIVTELGTKVDSHADRIEVRGKRIVREKKSYILLHKPRGTVTTRKDPEGRKTVLSLLSGVKERVFPVGRLDYNTSGTLILTNDGELSQALSHPRSRVPRTYKVKVGGAVTPEELERLRKGVDIGDGVARAEDVFLVTTTGNQSTIMMTIFEGRNHQIHRMLEVVGRRVNRLMRTSFGGVDVDGLAVGEWRHLKGRELGQLKKKYVNPARGRHRRQRRLPDE